MLEARAELVISFGQFLLCHFFVLYNGAVMHWCFDCTNKGHSNYFIYEPMPPIGHMDWIGFGSAFTSSLRIGLDWITELMDWFELDL